MSGLLLDTHALYWYETDDPQLSRPARTALAAGTRPLVVSAVTIWEMAIGLAKGRWPQVRPFFPDAAARLRGKGYRVVGIEAAQVERSATLPWLHNDPFDRLLIATAELEGLTLVTGDAQIRRYAVAWLW
jgi:PIN domain nuclease of toxin-antitoxin system